MGFISIVHRAYKPMFLCNSQYQRVTSYQGCGWVHGYVRVCPGAQEIFEWLVLAEDQIQAEGEFWAVTENGESQRVPGSQWKGGTFMEVVPKVVEIGTQSFGLHKNLVGGLEHDFYVSIC